MINKLVSFEQDYWARGNVVLGIDEAGYGCLAGSMYIAGVLYKKDFVVPTDLLKINDSKKLSESTRSNLAELIKLYAEDYFVLRVDADQINSGNPYWLRFSKAAEHINGKANFSKNTVVIYDGDRSLTDISFISESLIKGDSKSFSIASASILAKVSKDAEMELLSEEYPMYNFRNNKGYGTAAHIDAIQKYGLSPVHRTKYCSKYV